MSRLDEIEKRIEAYPDAILPEDAYYLIDRCRKLEKVAEAAKGFRDHGVAKNGTHAEFLFETLKGLGEE